MSASFDKIPSRTVIPLLISFIDVSRYARIARERDDRETAELLNDFYCRTYSVQLFQLQRSRTRAVRWSSSSAMPP